MTIKPFKIAACIMCTLFMLGGCTTLPPVSADKNLLKDVVTPGTLRETIFLKLGEPSGSFEAGRILTYRIGEDAERGYYIRDRYGFWTNTRYSLVLVFDEKGQLAKHNLVLIH
jgi:hypothetical protein